MGIVDRVKEKARSNLKTIVLPEGDEPRTVQAAAIIAKENLARPVLLGDPEAVRSVAREKGADIDGIGIVNPLASPKARDYAARLYELRKAKGLTEEDAARLAADPMYYGIMMVKQGDADGLVSGAVHSTGDMLRPALQIIKARPGIRTISSCFLMECPNKALGENGLVIFSDCVVVANPSAEELAEIAVTAAETARTLCGIEEPRVALLSFSTKGSAKHEMVDKVRRATALAHELAPGLTLDGELQLDAAMVPGVAALKAKGSPVGGRANVLIFPDLQAGNIGYKLVQRFAGASAFAILQGIAKPCNDLSRGCSVEDIVNTVAFTAVQAQATEG
ncbi:MAG: phosphate acetyltransferase [Clostridia bacterium]|nr:phosphate acetyltransferase [Clostridia bacterium]